MRLPAKQASCDQKNPFLNQATPPRKKKLAKISNPKILESPHAPTPTPSPLRSTPPWKKIYRLYKLGPPEAGQLKGAGCAELRKREHETIKWEEIVRAFFFPRLPQYLMRSLEQGQGALASRALFFASPRVNVHEKSLKKT